jgi:hypothetical protein
LAQGATDTGGRSGGRFVSSPPKQCQPCVFLLQGCRCIELQQIPDETLWS